MPCRSHRSNPWMKTAIDMSAVTGADEHRVYARDSAYNVNDVFPMIGTATIQ